MYFPGVAKNAIRVVICASLLNAQQPSNPPPADIVFSVTTLRVQVDAVVTDSKGHYVTDLTADDFAIYDDGKPQKITNFSYISVTPQLANGYKAEKKPAPKIDKAPPPSQAAPTRREDVHRTFVLMVDDLGLSFESTAYVRDALRKFVEQQMQPGDLAAICRTTSGSGAVQQFTTDKRVLRSVIEGLQWNLSGRRDSKVFAGAGEALNNAYDAERNRLLTIGTLGAINYIVGALRDMPGRKSIVLFSDGFPLFETYDDAAAGTDTYTEIQQALHRLLDRANRARTVIYTIHTLGLVSLQPDAQDRIDTGQGMTAQMAQRSLLKLTSTGQGRDLAFQKAQQGLEHLAAETGGLAYQNGNDINFGLNRVLEDQSGYYLIGFKPPEGTFDEKRGARPYHHVKVTVTRPGLHVRSRSGFFGETDEETVPKYKSPLEEMRAAMLSPFRSSDVHLRLTALYAQLPKRGAVVRNFVHIDTEDLAFRSSALFGDSASHIEVVGVATSMGYLPVGSVAQSYWVKAPADHGQSALKEGVVYTLDVPVRKPGAYQIQVAVRDTVTGKTGSASQFLEIPELKKARIAHTSVLLQSGDRLSPATRQFAPGSEVKYFCLVENPGNKVPAANLDSQIRVVRDGKEVYSGPVKMIITEDGELAVAGGLKLSEKMTPGDYYLGVVVTDRAAKNRVTAQWTDFEIVRE